LEFAPATRGTRAEIVGSRRRLAAMQPPSQAAKEHTSKVCADSVLHSVPAMEAGRSRAEKWSLRQLALSTATMRSLTRFDRVQLPVLGPCNVENWSSVG
jgi:hypothetical protein